MSVKAKHSESNGKRSSPTGDCWYGDITCTNCLHVVLQASKTVPVRVLPQVHEEYQHPYASHGKAHMYKYCFVFIFLQSCSTVLTYRIHNVILSFSRQSVNGFILQLMKFTVKVKSLYLKWMAQLIR